MLRREWMARKTATAPTTPKTPKKALAKIPAAPAPDEPPLVRVNLGDVAPTAYDWPLREDALTRWLRLRTTPIGMKLFTTVQEMEAIPRLRRPKSIHTTDQIVAMA